MTCNGASGIVRTIATYLRYYTASHLGRAVNITRITAVIIVLLVVVISVEYEVLKVRGDNVRVHLKGVDSAGS
jgi:hypothetical protein